MTALFKKSAKPKKTAKPAKKKKEMAAAPVNTLELAEAIRRVALRPILTEKGVSRQQHNQALFRVHKNANKYQIAQAVQAMYNIKPISIRTIQMKPKERRRGATVGKTNSWKKAYVTVPDIKALNIVP